MINYNIDFTNKEALANSIAELANKISMHWTLQVNDSHYHIMDFEFYIYSKSAGMQDAHTYNHKLQQTPNRIYDHASGVDFTFGDGDNALGVLIRGIARLDTTNHLQIEEYIDGPYKARTEIMGNLRFADDNIFLLEESQEAIKTFRKKHYKLITTSRVNLSDKKKGDQFFNEELRYICLVPKTNDTDHSILTENNKQIKISGLEKVIKENVLKGIIGSDDRAKVLGYNLKEWKEKANDPQ